MSAVSTKLSDELWCKGLGLIGGFTPAKCPQCGQWPLVDRLPGQEWKKVAAACACSVVVELIQPPDSGRLKTDAQRFAYAQACVRALEQWCEATKKGKDDAKIH